MLSAVTKRVPPYVGACHGAFSRLLLAVIYWKAMEHEVVGLYFCQLLAFAESLR